jgi:2-succinyl-5-enolpyruvyl-6-hydroxy-3-cyclohexene-1-carboxylate synthase
VTAVPSTLAARAFVAGLIGAGVTDACITPGSRSTPLTLAFAEQPAIKSWLHLDERSSAYFALGLARASGRPVAVVCTSGTAASNFAPAVAEASRSRVPLVVCTTDRPPRLRDRGGDQTIDQVGMFGRDSRWSADLPLLSDGAPERLFGGFARRAVQAALGPLPGPAHINFPFDEPLIEPPGMRPAASAAFSRRLIARSPIGPPDSAIVQARKALRASRRPLVVAGPETGGLPAAVAELARSLGAPLLADPLSGLRCGWEERGNVIDAYDAFLRDPSGAPALPDCVVRFGGVPTAKVLNQYLARALDAEHIHVDLPGSVRDPDGLATITVDGDAELAARSLIGGASNTTAEWLEEWQRKDRAARASLQASAVGFTEPFEGRVFVELQAALPDGATVVAGNSMPVRDLDGFIEASPSGISFVSNRGVNGIDGVTSAALGAAATTAGPVVLVIGDVSFYHDMNGLWAAKRHNLDLTIVLVNNDGGGIFHYLPQAAHDDSFEEWFGTAPGLDYSAAVGMYGGAHEFVDDWSRFRHAIAAGGSGLRVLELRTDRYLNAELHREAWAAACRAAAESARPVTA